MYTTPEQIAMISNILKQNGSGDGSPDWQNDGGDILRSGRWAWAGLSCVLARSCGNLVDSDVEDPRDGQYWAEGIAQYETFINGLYPLHDKLVAGLSPEALEYILSNSEISGTVTVPSMKW